MNNMNQILKQAQKMQEKLAAAQDELEKKEVTGTAGAGLINITMTVGKEVKSVSIEKSIINPDDKEMLEDLIVAAFNDATQKADSIFEKGMTEASGGFDISKLSRGMF
ncbi:MAG: YbaB/EbfC family nucleoid-associated protein [Holosporales bacterium]|nr:YbaB/EbfC family nucleoid-associated protein [Holosporales bacterium]